MGFVVSSTYTYHTPSGYIFRLRTPKDLQIIVGKTEFRYSLRSGFLREAKVKAQAIARYVHGLFEKVRHNITAFTKEMITGLVRSYVQQTLRNDEECKIQKKTYLEDNCWVVGGADMGVKEAQKALEITQMWLANNDHSYMECSANKLLEGMDYNVQDEDYNALLRELLKGYGDVLRVRLKRAEGDYSKTDNELVPLLNTPENTSRFVDEVVGRLTPLIQGANSTPVVDKPKAPIFSEITEQFLNHRKRENKTQIAYRNLSKLFTAIVGDLPVDELSYDIVDKFKLVLKELPPKFDFETDLKGRTFEQFIKENEGEKVTQKTLNDKLIKLGAIAKYAKTRRHAAINPFEDNKYDFEDDTRRDDEKRAMWETEELVKLFGSKEYLSGNLKNPAYYWVPLILLHTGARSNEICQLHLNDIQEDAGVHYFSFKPDTEDKKLKNKGTISRKNVEIMEQLPWLVVWQHH